MSGSDLTVVVVTYNGRDLALATLRSAIANSGPIEVEWLVVDNGSTDGTPEVIERELPEVRVLRAPNLGFAHGNNVALQSARGRYVLLLNPDVEILRGKLSALVAALDERPGVGAASVLHRGTDGGLLLSIRRFPSPARDLGEALFAPRWPFMRQLQELDMDVESYYSERPADWVSGAFLVARREAIEDVGPMDERFFLYSEEIDWCRRIRDAGWDIRHLPVIEITHHCGPTTPGRVAEECRSRVLYARKHFGRVRAAGIRGALALKHGLRLALLAVPALVNARFRARLRTEAFGLGVVLGLMEPPLSTRARSAAVAELELRDPACAA
jgi:GT2 family glycosyltransferase